MSVRQVRYRQNGVRTGRNLYMLNRGVSSSIVFGTWTRVRGYKYGVRRSCEVIMILMWGGGGEKRAAWMRCRGLFGSTTLCYPPRFVSAASEGH